jgi:hypothetical protein
MKTSPPFLGKLCVLSVFTACFAWGQATNSAEVTGSVTDPSKAVVPGVTVTVKDLDKNTERTFTTNDSGLYRIAQLPVGTTVIIDIVSGDYVTGTTWDLALDAFEQRFGTEERFSHSFTVGRPTFIGGGVWLK